MLGIYRHTASAQSRPEAIRESDATSIVSYGKLIVMPTGRYNHWLSYTFALLRNRAVRALLKPMIRWQPMASPQPGYSLIIAANYRLPHVLAANVRQLAHQQFENLSELLIVIDGMPDQFAEHQAHISALLPDQPIQWLYLNPGQQMRLKLARTPWACSWAGWAMALGCCRSRHAIIHDLDCLLIAPDFCDRRYRTLCDTQANFLGTHPYDYNHFQKDDRLVPTIEMGLDVGHLRCRFQPLDLFNYVTTHRGRTVDFDTFLWAQSRTDQRVIHPPVENDFIHPAQVICQYMNLVNRPIKQPPLRNNLFWIPYFRFLDQAPAMLEDWTQRLEDQQLFLPIDHVPMDGGCLSVKHARVIVDQITHAEQLIHGNVDPAVARYLQAISQYRFAQASD